MRETRVLASNPAKSAVGVRRELGATLGKPGGKPYPHRPGQQIEQYLSEFWRYDNVQLTRCQYIGVVGNASLYEIVNAGVVFAKRMRVDGRQTPQALGVFVIDHSLSLAC
jgi:hypothetical protein